MPHQKTKNEDSYQLSCLTLFTTAMNTDKIGGQF